MTTYTDDQMADACDNAADMVGGAMGSDAEEAKFRAAASRLRGLKDQAAVLREPTQAAAVGKLRDMLEAHEAGTLREDWPTVVREFLGDAATDQPAAARETTGKRDSAQTPLAADPERAALVKELRECRSWAGQPAMYALLQRALAQIVADGERIAADSKYRNEIEYVMHHAEQQERIAELERALREYGQHDPQCRKANNAHIGTFPCTCGFSKALEGAK